MKNRLWPYALLLSASLLLYFVAFTRQPIYIIILTLVLLMDSEIIASICSMSFSERTRSNSSKLCNEILAYLFMILGYISPFIMAGLLFNQYFMP